MNGRKLLYILLAGLQVVRVKTYSNAKRKWQLGHTAGAWEMEKQYDAVYPTFSDTIKVGSGHPSLPFKAFSFDGIGDHVQLILTDDDVFKTFSILMLVFPGTTTGTLLHYRFGQSGIDGLDDITVTANNGDVIVDVQYQGTSWIFTEISALTSGNWQYIILKRDYDSDQIGININGASSTHSGPTIEYLGAPGTLWLGKNIDTGNYYKGKMTCVLLFDYVFTDAEMSEAYSECSGLAKSPGPSNIIDVDLTTTHPITSTAATSTTVTSVSTTTVTTTDPITTTSTTSAPVIPISLWRLDDVTYVYSTDGVAPMYPSTSQCSRLSDGSPDLLGRKALMLDGASVTYFDLDLSPQVIQSDFQIAFEVSPGYPSTGTMVHFKYAGSDPGIHEVKLSVFSSEISLTLFDSTTACGQIVQANVLPSDKWFFIMIERQASEIKLVVDSNVYTAADTCTVGTVAGSGYIRLGNNIDANDGFRGRMTCLGVYNATQPDRRVINRMFCQTLTPTVMSFDTTVCKEIPAMRNVYYSLDRVNVQPEVGISPVHIATTSGLRHCSRLCIETMYCFSFTLKVNMPNDKLCTLYDFVTRNEGLANTLETNYYVIRQRE